MPSNSRSSFSARLSRSSFACSRGRCAPLKRQASETEGIGCRCSFVGKECSSRPAQTPEATRSACSPTWRPREVAETSSITAQISDRPRRSAWTITPTPGPRRPVMLQTRLVTVWSSAFAMNVDPSNDREISPAVWESPTMREALAMRNVAVAYQFSSARASNDVSRRSPAFAIRVSEISAGEAAGDGPTTYWCGSPTGSASPVATWALPGRSHR